MASASGGMSPGDQGRQDSNLKPVDLKLEESLAIAEGLFFSYVKELEQHRVELAVQERGEVDQAKLKAATTTAKVVREAILLLMTERNKVDKLRKDIAGGVGGGSLDLDAARDEIGRRLACLRRAGAG